MSIIKTAPKATVAKSNAAPSRPVHVESTVYNGPGIKVGQRTGRPSSGKIVVSLRLEPAVIQRFKATGPGWQARINDALKAAKIP